MSDIEWENGAACYAGGKQWFHRNGEADGVNEADLVNESASAVAGTSLAIERKDFQLNHIRTEDYIQASELDTEQKYNDVVEVFGLFGFEFMFKDKELTGRDYIIGDTYSLKVVETSFLVGSPSDGKRQLTYSQVMAIGKLKRMMDERENIESHPKNLSLSKHQLDAIEQKENGQKHDQSKPRFSLIPLEPLQDVIAVLEFGAAKYGAYNWKHVENPQQRYLDAFMRHTMAWQSGELVDEESGLPHLAHAQCCLLFLQHFDK